MGLAGRISTIFKAKANKVLDKAEDPREVLDYSYERQLELLQQVRRGLADVATSRKRVELQAQQLAQLGTKLEDQAKQALAQNQEDLAKEALSRRQVIVGQLTDLKAQHDQLADQEAKLEEAEQRLQAKVEAFRVRKETIKASYTAAEAQTKIGEAVSGISEEMGDVGLAMQRAEDRTAQMQARAGAIDELLGSGALDDLTQPADHIQGELDKVSTASAVDGELAKLKAEMGAGSEPKALGDGGAAEAAAAPAGGEGGSSKGGAA